MFKYIAGAVVHSDVEKISKEDAAPLMNVIRSLMARAESHAGLNKMYASGNVIISLEALAEVNFPEKGFMLATATPEEVDNKITSGGQAVLSDTCKTLMLIDPEGSLIISVDADGTVGWYAGYEDDLLYLDDHFDDLL